MPRLAAVALIALASLPAGCSRPPPTSSPEAVVAAAFDALHDSDWDAYSALTITTADFILKEQKLTGFKQKGTYVGDKLKPEEKNRQREQFQKAGSGGPNTIDFREAKLDRPILVASAQQELMSGSVVPVALYGLALKDAGSQASQLDPGFVVVQWSGGYRLLGLRFRAEE
jgi:hypothetical protein